MHEMSLVMALRQTVEETAKRERAQRVSAVVLEVGELAAVDVEALQFCFTAVMKGSIAETTHLYIERLPGVAWCLPCAQSLPLPALGAACPLCGGYQLTVTAGTEMRIKAIDIE